MKLLQLDGLLNTEIFFLLNETREKFEQYRLDYNTIRPHSSLDYRPLVEYARAKSININRQIKP